MQWSQKVFIQTIQTVNTTQTHANTVMKVLRQQRSKMQFFRKKWAKPESSNLTMVYFAQHVLTALLFGLTVNR